MVLLAVRLTALIVLVLVAGVIIRFVFLIRLFVGIMLVVLV
jgi:hypothetical protein